MSETTRDKTQRPRDDPSIAEAAVLYHQIVKRGSRVKHYAQRFTGMATATVVGFYNEGSEKNPWIKVLIKGDDPNAFYSVRGAYVGWDYDRTEVAPDSDFN